MKKLKDFFKKVRIDTILRAILLLILGILFLINPTTMMVSFTTILAVFIICDGVVSFILYFFTGGLSGFFGSSLLGSIFKIIFGILLTLDVGFSTTFISIMVALYIIIISANAIEESMYLSHVGEKYIVSLILGFISLALGITMLFLSPGNLLKVTGIICGITLIIAFVEDLMLVISMYKVKRRLETKVIDPSNIING